MSLGFFSSGFFLLSFPSAFFLLSFLFSSFLLGCGEIRSTFFLVFSASISRSFDGSTFPTTVSLFAANSAFAASTPSPPPPEHHTTQHNNGFSSVLIHRKSLINENTGSRFRAEQFNFRILTTSLFVMREKNEMKSDKTKGIYRDRDQCNSKI